ncbi:MAG: hypothetical protein ABIO45_06125 [Burkholderiaceae bacterium]
MNSMADIHRSPRGATSSTHTDEHRSDQQRWQDLVSQIGAEIAGPLTAALERIHALTTTGRIDRTSLRALRDEVDRARQTGMLGQQLARFASGRLRQSHERLQLAETLKGVLAHRARETQARGIALKPSLKPADVIVDASLLFSLLNTTLDWALANACSQIEFQIEIKTWPAHAVLNCRFAHRLADQPKSTAASVDPSAGLDSLTWRFLQQTATTMGLPLERHDDAVHTALSIEFPRTASAEIAGVTTMEIDEGFAPSSNSKPLAGSHVLVVTSQRDLRAQIRGAIGNMGLIVDFVASVDEMTDFCREGLPHAIVVDSAQLDDRFQVFREQVSTELPEFVFIEIVEQGESFQMSAFSETNMARVGRHALSASLPSALMFELSKSL